MLIKVLGLDTHFSGANQWDNNIERSSRSPKTSIPQKMTSNIRQVNCFQKAPFIQHSEVTKLLCASISVSKDMFPKSN